MINGLLSLSTSLRDNKFKFWTDCNGTFGSIMLDALNERNFDPESIDIDCKNRKLTIKSTGKVKNIQNCSVNGILKLLNLEIRK
jgi:hypothetical protein